MKIIIRKSFVFCVLSAGGLIFWAGQAAASQFTNLLNLAITNGASSQANLVISDNAIYGTTSQYGGPTGSANGTAFKINTDGTGFTNLHAFTGGSDGGTPDAGLVLSGSNLFGVTYYGGKGSAGTIFAVSTNGVYFTNLHSFTALSTNSPATNIDGANPYATLAISGNTLFGTTIYGGFYGNGTIFRINTDGTDFTNLYNFTAYGSDSYTNADGSYAYAGVIVSGTTLFGAAYGGGPTDDGTFYAIHSDGTGFTNLFNFGYDGSGPFGGLLLVGGTIYGSTYGGGYGAGTLFSISTNGSSFTNLHNFSFGAGPYQTNSDGRTPYAALTLVGNTLYGPAGYGGIYGSGTLFSVDTNGYNFQTLYNFSAINTNTYTNSDGNVPRAPLSFSGGSLYGMTFEGGNYDGGTLFSFLVPPQLNIARSGTNVILTWPTNDTGFSLQSSPTLKGPFTNIPAATPPYTNPITSTPLFFRLSNPRN